MSKKKTDCKHLKTNLTYFPLKDCKNTFDVVDEDESNELGPHTPPFLLIPNLTGGGS